MEGLACRCRHADWECASWVTGDGNEAGADTPLEKLEKGLRELRLRGGVTTAQEGTERETYSKMGRKG